MSTYISNLIHFVWGTAKREPLIRNSWREELHGYVAGVLKNKKVKALQVGGTGDHVHVLASLPATLTLAEVANAMKANSSRWIHENAPQSRGFDWQEGYGAFSVSKSAERRVREYIQNQEEHHSGRTFEEEFRALLGKHGIPYEERYLWV
jgi:REP element-mobilizing transposase RayT